MQRNGFFKKLTVFALGLAATCAARALPGDGTPEEAAAESKVADPCDLAFDAIYLKSTRRERGSYYGTFQIRPDILSFGSESFVIEGVKKKDGFYVEEPSASFEFIDLNGQWHWLMRPPGTYSAPPDQLSMADGRSVEVVIQLPSTELAALASEWRVLLRAVGNGDCVRSIPFRAIQSRGPVKGFVSKVVQKPVRRQQGLMPCRPCDKSLEPKAADKPAELTQLQH